MFTHYKSIIISLPAFILTCILSGIAINGFSQIATISGQVKDSKSLEPLPFATVFISNTTIGAATDQKGFFKLTNVPIGHSDLVISFIGYVSYQTRIKLTDGQQLVVNARLVAEEKMLDTVEVRGKRDKLWNNQLKKFTTAFLGTGATSCKIINPWVLEFSETNGVLTAKALADLNIENRTLGYTITYSLKKFELKTGEILILGNARYQEMKTSNKKNNETWNANRWDAYAGSRQHLIYAILHHKIHGEGFSLYTDKNGFENSPRTTVFAKELGHSIEELDTNRIQITPDPGTGGSEIHFPKRMEVHYSKGIARVNTYEDISSPVSWIEIKKGSFKVDQNGTVLNPENVITSGYMNSLRIADMLPSNYKPEPITGSVKENASEKKSISEEVLATKFKASYEKIYAHTDKPYYYPGERIWFKAYVNYYIPKDRDILSKTVYVELINSTKEILTEKMLRLDAGLASGDFILPDSIKEGNYYLRVYTQLQRNFGHENLFIKVLPVLKLSDKPVYSIESQSSSMGLQVIPDKEFYKTRDKITLTLQAKDQDDNPLVANFSVSVTDASQVIALPDSSTIIEKFPIKTEEIGTVHELNYLPENGFALQGQFSSSNGKGVKTQLNMIQLNPYQLAVDDSDEQGYFQFTDLQFYGETSLSITSAKDKGKSKGQIKIFKHNIPPVILKNPDYTIQLTETQTVQRIYSEYDKRADSKMLQEVIIEDKRIANTNSNSPYSADYAFEEKRIKTQFPNLLYTLQSLNIAGLVVNPNEQTVYFARSSKPVLSMGTTPMGSLATYEEIAKSYTPMVTLDGMPLMGSAGEVLISIDPNAIGSIEVTKKQSTVRGSLAPYGVIALYSKTGYIPTRQDPVNVNFIKVQGYAIPNKFIYPDYQNSTVNKENIDYRSTLYWNPAVTTDSSTGTSKVSFFASDLRGPYRVVIEGVDATGKPLRSVSFIQVKD